MVDLKERNEVFLIINLDKISKLRFIHKLLFIQIHKRNGQMFYNEKNLSTKQDKKGSHSRFSSEDAFDRRHQSS